MAKKDKGDGEAKPGGKKKLVIIVAAAAVLLAGGTGAGVFLMTKGDTAAAAETKEEVLEPGDVTTLDPISVNLADGHYLKIGVALQAVLAEGGGEGHGSSSTLDGSKAYDLIISEFSNLSMSDLENADQRNHYKDELTAKIIEAYTTEDTEGVAHKGVMGLYLTQFVMQ